jgi:hypothetical protein
LNYDEKRGRLTRALIVLVANLIVNVFYARGVKHVGWESHQLLGGKAMKDNWGLTQTLATEGVRAGGDDRIGESIEADGAFVVFFGISSCGLRSLEE